MGYYGSSERDGAQRDRKAAEVHARGSSDVPLSNMLQASLRKLTSGITAISIPGASGGAGS